MPKGAPPRGGFEVKVQPPAEPTVILIRNL